jgi:hypothetical protein
VSRAAKVSADVATQVLDAGGLLPVGAKPPAGERVDTVVARGYRHPVLGDRVVVRLTAENVAAGDDLEMEVLGFGAAEPRGAIGQERKRPLGFPGWALVNDPKHARHALDVVRDMKKQIRRVKSKPGFAKEGIDKLGERLGKTVPHFLPSFYEEVGRAFIEHGALSYAAMMFGKAREAELVHALDIDENHRAHAFLEFALAGAVTTKALAQYAKDLAETRDAPTAYALFRELCVKRTLGGMPPWGGMAKELRKLAKAAGKDPDTEDAAFIAEVLDSPALVNAAGEFWRAYAEPIKALAKASPARRGQLLDLWPTPSSGGVELDAEWIDLLEQSGATRALYEDGEPADAQPSGGRAAWFDKLVAHTTRRWRQRVVPAYVFGILRRMAPRLVADGAPIACRRSWSLVDVDLAELALELGVPVKPPDRSRIDLEDWAKHADEPEHGRDPVRVAAHPQLAPLVVSSVAQHIGTDPFDTGARGKAGLAAAKRKWVEGVIAAAETGGLPAVETALETIDKRVSAATFAEMPDLHARLAALDVAPALARTLRGGIIDELGWPTLEAAITELDPHGDGTTKLSGAFPTLVVTNGIRAIVVGPAGRLAEHDLQLPPKADLHAIRWAQGQLVVMFRHEQKAWAYWSSNPADAFALDGYFYNVPMLGLRSVVLEDGAVCEGGLALRAGDRAISLERTPPISDGTTIWRTEWKDGEHKLREVSPATGDLGRFSWPAFFESYLAEGWKLNLGASYLHPAPGLRSAFGVDNGMLGVRARQPADPAKTQPAWQLETIDGVRWEGLAAGGYPIDLLKLPGDERRRPVLMDTSYRSATGWICDPTGAYRSCRVDATAPGYSRGQAAVLAVRLWHLLVPRDPGGSAILRDATDDQARALVDSVDTGGARSDDLPADLSAPDAALAARLPAIADARLRKGIAGIVGLARRFELVKTELVASRDPANAAKIVTARLDDATLKDVLGGGYRWNSASGSIAAQIATAAAALFETGDALVDELPTSSLEWEDWALAPGALAFTAAAFGHDADHRREAGRLLELFVQTGLVAASGHLRLWRGAGNLGLADGVACAVVRRAGNAYFLRRQYTYRTGQTQWTALEYAPTGAFTLLPNMTLEWERRGTPADAGAIKAFLAQLASGAPAWSTEAAALIARTTGLTYGEAALVWAGFPRLADSSAGFLGKEAREAMGLKSPQASAARDSLLATPMARRLQIMAAAASDPASLWDPIGGGAALRMAEAWNTLCGVRTPIPDDLLVAADKDMQAPLPPHAALAMLANPSGSAALTTDGVFGFSEKGELVRGSTPGQIAVTAAAFAEGTTLPPVADLPTLHTVAVYLPYLFAQLPVGDPLRAQLPVAYELVQKRLDNPDLWLHQAGNTHYNEDSEKTVRAALDAFSAEELPLPPPVQGRVGPGGAVVRRGNSVSLYLRPSQLVTATDLSRMRLHTQHYARWDVSTRDVIAYLRSDELARMMKRVTDTPVPAGGWEQNPLASVPDLVARAAKHLGVSAEAAAVYLQMLTLLWPTPKNVQTWNDWTANTYKKAVAELEEKELVLEAKRERAQRSHFLPGGWEALKSPHAPMETWKVPLYSDERTATGDPKPRFQRFFAFDAPHALFELAWARIEADDPPRYEEVKK